MIWRLIKIWFGVLCVSVVCTWSIYWFGGEYLAVADWAACYVFGLSVGAATMFLNCIRKVHNNGWLRFLSFYLVPMAMSAMTLSGNKDAWELWDEIHILFAPFFVCLTVGYVWFSREIKNAAA